MITDLLSGISEKPGETLGWVIVVGLPLSLYSAKQGTLALFEGLNIEHNEIEERGFQENALKFAGTPDWGLLLAALVVACPPVICQLGLPVTLDIILRQGR